MEEEGWTCNLQEIAFEDSLRKKKFVFSMTAQEIKISEALLCFVADPTEEAITSFVQYGINPYTNYFYGIGNEGIGLALPDNPRLRNLSILHFPDAWFGHNTDPVHILTLQEAKARIELRRFNKISHGNTEGSGAFVDASLVRV